MAFFIMIFICFGGAMAIFSFHMQKHIRIQQQIGCLNQQAEYDLEKQNFEANQQLQNLTKQTEIEKAFMRKSSKYVLIFWVPLMWCMILMHFVKNRQSE